MALSRDERRRKRLDRTLARECGIGGLQRTFEVIAKGKFGFLCLSKAQ
jgi:hypothetical protein